MYEYELRVLYQIHQPDSFRFVCVYLHVNHMIVRAHAITCCFAFVLDFVVVVVIVID